jgi:hypothetical protein
MSAAGLVNEQDISKLPDQQQPERDMSTNTGPSEAMRAPGSQLAASQLVLVLSSPPASRLTLQARGFRRRS